jgi:hypothetical protein
MKKTADVTKYQLDWQIVRVKAKKIKEPLKKVDFVLDYYNKNKNYDNWERCVNWMEGLAMGYKIPAVRQMIEDRIEDFVKVNNREQYSEPNYKKYSNEDLYECLRDNWNRYSLWSSKGYIHRELETFIDNLIRYLNGTSLNIKVNGLKQKFMESQAKIPKKNNYKFIFR